MNIGFRGVDISPDDTKIIFAHSTQKQNAIYEMNVADKKIKKLIKAEKNTVYVNPKYSPDGKNIVFIKYNSNDVTKSILYKAKSDGTNITQLTDGNTLITEGDFSINNEQIVFCKANEYSKNSPIGLRSAHQFDIYSINTDKKNISRLTSLNAYGLNHLSVLDSSFIFRLEAGQKGGMYQISKQTPDKLEKLIPSNNPRKDESLYYAPTYSQKFRTFVFTAPYEIYSMDSNNFKAVLIYDSKGSVDISEIKLFNELPTILFTKLGEDNFYFLSIYGGESKKIEVNINNYQK